MTDLDKFLDTYGRDRVALDIEVPPMTDDGPPSPFIVVRYKGRALVLNAMALGDDQDSEHLCLDVHAYVDGADARVGAFGMENGRRVSFPKDRTPGTSHRWAATRMVALLLGRQEETLLHEHDCDGCVPLGQFHTFGNGGALAYDLYVCDTTLLARFGVESDYVSGKADVAENAHDDNVHMRALHEALLRARKAGLHP